LCSDCVDDLSESAVVEDEVSAVVEDEVVNTEDTPLELATEDTPLELAAEDEDKVTCTF